MKNFSKTISSPIGAIILFMVFIFTAGKISASDYLFSSISLSEGLVHPSVKSVCRDSRDYLWIGTKGGLNRYDHGEMKTYKRNPAIANSLPDNDIIEIFEDGKNNLWIITATGVVVYDRSKDNFRPVSADGKPLRARSHLLIPTGVIFGGAGNLFYYDYDSGEITARQTQGGSDKYYTAIHPWSRDRYILTTRWDGAWIYNTRTGEIEPSSVIKGKRIMASLIDSDGELWISEYGNGISHFNRSGHNIPVSIPGIGKDAIILDIIEKDGCLILATDGAGLYKFNKKTGNTHHFNYHEDSPRSLRSVNCLYKDSFDHIYAGTVRGGLVYISSTPMKTISLSPEMESFTVTSIVADKNNAWLGIDGNGIMLFEPDNYNRVSHVEESSGLKVVSMDDFDENTLLISTYDNGLLLFNKNTRTLSKAPNWLQLISDGNKNTGIPLDVKRLSDNRIALITDKIYISDLEGKKVAVIEPEGVPNRLRVFYSDFGNLLCYNDHQVFNVDLDEETIAPLCKIDDSIECAVYDGSRFIYTGTSSGVKQYDFETGLVGMANPSSRMPQGSGITSLAYNDGDLWIGALGQLYQRNTQDGGIRRFGPGDGVTPNEFIYKSVLTTPDHILMGGVNGLLKVNLQDLSSYNLQATKSPLALMEVLVDGLPMELNGKTARLPENYSLVKLRLSGGNSSPVDAERIRIYVGEKKSGSAIETTDHTLSLGHLQASRGGKYDIYASVRDINGQWTPPDHVGSILVPIAWWRKPFAIIIICVLALAAVAFAIVYYYTRRRNKVMNRIEEHRRQSLEKEVGFLMNLNYELRTPLTLIYSRLKMLTDKVNSGEISEKKMLDELDKIYRNTGKMRDIINTTVDLWRSGDMKTGEILEETDVDLWIKEILNELRPTIHEKRITVKTEPSEHHETMLCDLRRASIALINVLRSTIDHASEKSEITISIKGEEDSITIFFTFFNDQSHGAGEEFRYAGHLMALMDGELAYTRNESGGPSEVYMKFPRELKRQIDTTGNLSGTVEDESSIRAANHENDNADEMGGFNLSHLTVIVVEDDVELRELLVSALSSVFNKVLDASNGQDALTIIKNSNPDLIITEARLPKMSGLELCRIIKKTKQYSHIPVIMLTTRLEEMSIANGNNFGADNYLTKPFDIGVLEKRCYSVLKSFDRVKQWYKSQVSDIIPTEKRHNNDAEVFILKVREIIEKNIGTPGFGVDDIVNQMLVSRSTLYGKFKELTGQSLGNYINDFKLNKAKEMLVNTDMTMVEISDALGFATQRYFSTFFKNQTGMTPTAFRNQQAAS